MARELPSDIRPSAPPRPTSPTSTESMSSPPLTKSVPSPTIEEPLYTEIRIPLPRLAQQPPSWSKSKSKSPYTSACTSTSRSRAHTIASSLSPFHKRISSSPGARREQGSNDAKNVTRDLASRKKRAETVGALAVLPAVLMLSAELFTPEEKDRNEKGH
ncbi:hypothetical protein K504DRAFT_458370 [Pleomassaria siparia CBS 279.74]|uniref:Uncharacterized protein n=1 Tax=Pleomassaria siparia CBS 279.74 TaxID=1314801 RepID=A0A6G1K5J4_9PLEO|nr:hypothetical protein K504DRAFT_458370 [Pleomassaria siparia CBS 279.74]